MDISKELKKRAERLQQRGTSSTPPPANTTDTMDIDESYEQKQFQDEQNKNEKIEELTQKINKLVNEMEEGKKKILHYQNVLQQEKENLESKEKQLKVMTNKFRSLHSGDNLSHEYLSPNALNEIQQIEHQNVDNIETKHDEEPTSNQITNNRPLPANTSLDEDYARQLQEQFLREQREEEHEEQQQQQQQQQQAQIGQTENEIRSQSAPASSFSISFSSSNGRPVVYQWRSGGNTNNENNRLGPLVHRNTLIRGNDLEHHTTQNNPRQSLFSLFGFPMDRRSPSSNLAGNEFFNFGPMAFHNVNLDHMDYEQMAELFQNIPRGASQETIEQLPVDTYHTPNAPKETTQSNEKKLLNKENSKCCICLDTFQTGDTIRRLPCLHIFHKNEIDEWLSRNHICPICRLPIDEQVPAEFRHTD